MNKLTLILGGIILYTFYSTLQDIKIAGKNITETLLLKKNEVWENHSNMPEPCAQCHLSYYNRLDVGIRKFKDWKGLNDFVHCKNKYKNRLKDNSKMPCLDSPPLVSKLVFKILNNK